MPASKKQIPRLPFSVVFEKRKIGREPCRTDMTQGGGNTKGFISQQ
jgi:hypothetical protein